MPTLCAPVKFLVLPAIYDNVYTGVHHQEQMGEVSKKVRPEQPYFRHITATDYSGMEKIEKKSDSIHRERNQLRHWVNSDTIHICLLISRC